MGKTEKNLTQQQIEDNIETFLEEELFMSSGADWVAFELYVWLLLRLKFIEVSYADGSNFITLGFLNQKPKFRLTVEMIEDNGTAKK